MRKFLLSILLMVGGVVTCVAANPGDICSKAIPIGNDFQMNITGPFPKTVWYMAYTFDLPLTVYFAPTNPSDPEPEVVLDFTCTPGFYTDSVLCSLFCQTGGGSGIDFGLPHKAPLSTGTLPDGRLAYYLSLGKKYRDLLLQMGITENLPAYVKVTYKSAGEISLAPNDMFANCMDGFKFIQLGDTVNVKTQDKSRHVIVPYVQWQEDSIRYVWNGTAPVTVAIGTACSFDPTVADEDRLDAFDLQAQDTMKLTSADLKYYLKNAETEAGMFYAKFYTNGTGTMKIERVPQAPPRGGAILLRYDRSRAVTGDTTELFAIPYTWTGATLFTAPTDHVFRMYIGTDPNFYTKDAIASYQFHKNDTCHWLGLYADQMKNLWKSTNEQYLYVRFECTQQTSILPKTWYPSTCLENTKETFIGKDTTFTITSKSSTIYRFYYNDWLGGDLTIKWNKSTECRVLVAKRCGISNTNGTASYLVWTTTLSTSKTGKRTADQIAAWANKEDDQADTDGYMYMRFYCNGASGKITIKSTAPDEVDPAPIVYPAATISVTCDGEPTAAGQEYIIRVSKAQTLSLDNGTPWTQTPAETHPVTLSSGIHILQGEDGETVQIEVK